MGLAKKLLVFSDLNLHSQFIKFKKSFLDIRYFMSDLTLAIIMLIRAYDSGCICLNHCVIYTGTQASLKNILVSDFTAAKKIMREEGFFSCQT